MSRRPYEVILEDLSPELRFNREVTVLEAVGEHEVEGIREVFVARRGTGAGLRFYGGGFWLDGKAWVPNDNSIVMVTNDVEVERIFLFTGGKFLPLNDFVFEPTIEIPPYKMIRASSELAFEVLTGFFPIKTKELLKGVLFSWVVGRIKIRFLEAGWYRFYVYWEHSFSDAPSTRIKDATLFWWRDGVNETLDTCLLKIPIMTGLDYYIPVVSLQGYFVDKVEKSTEIGFRYEFTQDVGGVPLTTTNNDGSIRFIIEKVGGVYGGGFNK